MSRFAPDSLIARLDPARFPRHPRGNGGSGFDRESFTREAETAGVSDAEIDEILQGPAAQLLDATAACSPFLAGLIRQDAARLVRLLSAPPDQSFNDLLDTLVQTQAALDPDNTGLAHLMAAARRTKGEVALLTALADLGGVWPVMKVTRVLSRFADTAVAASVRFLFRKAASKGDWLTERPDQPDFDSGYAVLAMGKHGANELNYSSDIDLIVVYDREMARVRDGIETHAFYVRLTQELVKLLQQRTPDGYVFRVDLRLRPDPAATQVAVPMDAAAVYYESVGQNWERAAMIKARPV
ncbi:MAG: bifunctional [glutamine synthetase] adenylyltransferase/[glutamine synthetase]-adenylyl-L-tyrosine phosphorylase, partial [Pseudomonadota bacterium]